MRCTQFRFIGNTTIYSFSYLFWYNTINFVTYAFIFTTIACNTIICKCYNSFCCKRVRIRIFAKCIWQSRCHTSGIRCKLHNVVDFFFNTARFCHFIQLSRATSIGIVVFRQSIDTSRLRIQKWFARLYDEENIRKWQQCNNRSHSNATILWGCLLTLNSQKYSLNCIIYQWNSEAI